jgi:hypothetical protein
MKMMEAVLTSQTSVYFIETIRRYIPEICCLHDTYELDGTIDLKIACISVQTKVLTGVIQPSKRMSGGCIKLGHIFLPYSLQFIIH